ncbi:MAG TPA: amino acid--[acyl-carrier-protein] ligase [Methylibium sp.]|nr:amino acid--[acyl-carrier-protein] ligase [Methylibium sp.]
MPDPDRLDPQSLYDGLVAHGLIVPTGVPGAFGRGAVFEDVLERFNACVSTVAAPDQAEVFTFPPVIDRRVLERVNYLESFPHLCGSVHSFFGNELQSLALAERAREGKDWGELLGQTAVVLNPAACYPLYPSLAGRLPEQGRRVTMLNWVFRHEPSAEPTRMQSFRVREFVCAGTAEQVLDWRDDWLQRGLELLRSLGLAAQPEVASDPFFGRGGRMLAVDQREQKLKYEIVVPVISAQAPTAIGSFNFHRDHFGSTFGIQTADGGVASTACLGFGLERVVMALFRTHGFEPTHWPADVRSRLWP